jgi:hypothetical protein
VLCLSLPLPKAGSKRHKTPRLPNKTCSQSLSNLSYHLLSLVPYLLVCPPASAFEDACACLRLLDGLSIPFFSAGRRTLTLSRSMITDQPDWLQWVRRVPPQEDAERLATTNANETQREGQNYMESSGLSDMSDPIPEGVKTPRRVLKFEDVCIALLPWHLTFLTCSDYRTPEARQAKESQRSTLDSLQRSRLELFEAIADCK